jgi:hypothetical protein
MSKLNSDGNILGRLGAVVLLVAVGVGLHRLNCATGDMCPLMRTDSCCAGAEGHAKAGTLKAATVPAEAAK